MNSPTEKGNDNAPEPNPALVARKARGPRTSAGKQRSKRNRLKFGIFSEVLLLPNEPRDQFNALLRGLRRRYPAKEIIREILVDKFAAIIWRQRRMLLAENAELRKAVASPAGKVDHRSGMPVFVEVKFEGEENHSGLMQQIAGSEVSEEDRCLQLLRELQLGIKTRGFDRQVDSEILTRLYGRRVESNESKTLFNHYQAFALKTDGGEQDEETFSKRREEEFLARLDEEIRRIETYKSSNSGTCNLEALGQNIPYQPQLDHIARYESALDRSFYRVLAQLEAEALRQMRLG